MADIRIQKHQRKSWLPRIIFFVVTVGLIWLSIDIAGQDRDKKKNRSAEVEEWMAPDNTNRPEWKKTTIEKIDEYVVFVNNSFRTGVQSQDDVDAGIRRLSAVVQELFRLEGIDDPSILNAGERLSATAEADAWTESAALAAGILAALQDQEYPELEGAGKAVQSSVEALKQSSPDRRSDAAKDFFFATAGALESIKQTLD